MKNIITNILGLIFWGFSVYEMLNEASIYHILVYVIVGIVLFRYKWSDTKKVIDTIIRNKTGKVDNLRMTVDPDKEEVPDERG